jgi:hypothetical protein
VCRLRAHESPPSVHLVASIYRITIS